MRIVSSSLQPRRGAALTWVVVAVVILSVAGAGLVYVRNRARQLKLHPVAHLEGSTATLDLGGGVGLELVRINPGQFMMGAPESDPDFNVSEGPVHPVTIAKPFFIGKYEITQGQWKIIRGNQSHANQGDRFPADGVGWSDAANWCKEMSGRLGVTMRLPTEAEWEYACRAGTTTAFAFGDKLAAGQAKFNTGDPQSLAGQTAPVGSFKPNAWGLYDMHGNVWEWCQDTLQEDYAKAPTDGSAWVDLQNQYKRVRRGGSWKDTASALRSASRWSSNGDAKEPDMRNDQVGFRVVVEVPAGK
jgi:formylglycine-generating enzyme required for sulfatase activity